MTPAQHDWLLDLPDKVFQQLRMNIHEHTTLSVLVSAELPAPAPYSQVVLTTQKAPQARCVSLPPLHCLTLLDTNVFVE